MTEETPVKITRPTLAEDAVKFKVNYRAILECAEKKYQARPEGYSHLHYAYEHALAAAVADLDKLKASNPANFIAVLKA